MGDVLIPTTPGEATVLAGKVYTIHPKVEIKDAGGSWVDYSDYVDIDLQDRIEVSIDVDARIQQATISLVRETGGNSIAPLVNSDIAIGRAVRIGVARVAAGVTPSEWKPLFEGTIDEWGHPETSGESDPNRLVLVARDGLAAIQDRWVETATVYSTDAGTPLEDVMQAILNDWADGIVLYVPTPTGEMAGAYKQDQASVLSALQTLAELIGWVIEWRWDSVTDAWRPTLYEPDRDPSGTDWTFGPDDYFAVTSLKVSRYNIRNVITVQYPDADAEGERTAYTVSDPTSITKYGRRWMEIEESDESPINSEARAAAMADPALLDLSEPMADQEIRCPLFWPVQLGDFYEFLANGVHYDANQEFGVVGYTHTLEAGTGTTAIRTRGRPVGSVRGWLKRESLPRRTAQEKADALKILNFRIIGRSATQIIYGGTLGLDLAAAWVHNYLEAAPYSEDRWPGAARLPDEILTDRDFTITVDIPEQGFDRYLQVEGRTTDGSLGCVERALIFPSNVQGDFIAFLAVKVNQTDGSAEIRGWATDRALSVAYAYNLGDADRSAPTVLDAESQGGGADGGGLLTGFTSDFIATLPAGTVAYGETIKVMAVAYIAADGTGADGTSTDHGPPVGAQDERLKITDADQITDGIVLARKLKEGQQSFIIVGQPFSASAWNQVNWSSFTLTLASGTSYSMSSGNTGAMGSDAIRYIYWDPDTSTTVLQLSTTASDATGDRKLLLCIARRALAGAASGQPAFYVPAVGVFGLDGSVIGANAITTTKITDDAITTPKIVAGAITATKIAANTITASQIAANTITAGQIAANTITAAEMNVASLSAISANLGTVTAGTISTSVLIASSKLTASSVRMLGDVRINGTGSDDTNETFKFLATGLFGAARMILKDYSNRTGGTIQGTFETLALWSDGGGVLIGVDGDKVGFYDATPVALQTGVAVTAAGIHAALVNLGLITA